MKKIFLMLILIGFNAFSQDVIQERMDFQKTLDSDFYDTAQFTNSHANISRPFIIIVTTRNQFTAVYNRISEIYRSKQKYTDIHVLGLTGPDAARSAEVYEKIVTHSLNAFREERLFYGLPVERLEQIRSKIVYLNESATIYEYLICP